MGAVSNASPLIFLNKIGQVQLPRKLFRGPFLISSHVRFEILEAIEDGEEKKSLQAELTHWKVKEIKPDLPKHESPGSPADWSVFKLARQSRPDVVLADDRFLRRILSAAQFPVLGTLGILTLATRRKIISAKEARASAELLVEKHRFWIDASVYSRFLRSLK
ncbi:MAG: hypothetical protein A3A86_05795 [Elusimicrobia bacterium RIFCSPLOWO2_01_FULL_60_11]|nr:MAG: hypothetical protein A3A86_05795 [Elusimicrobia bacterium RIFCSPLOWO2_01_FULL_60_11]